MLKRFYLKILLLSTPFILMSITYFVFDPFMVLHKYDRYDVPGAFLNEAYVGWRTYTTYKDSLKYDSFLMGNSCTMGTRTHEWEKHLNGGKAIRFYDNSETIGGVCHKLEILDAKNATINHVLILLDPKDFRIYTPKTTFKNILPPDASGMGVLPFHIKFLQGYLYPNVLVTYLQYKITGEVTPYMERKYIVTPHVVREAFTNNGLNPRDEKIAELGEQYWKQEEWVKEHEAFDKGSVCPPEIFPDQIRCLEKIKAICDKHNANLKLIINPHYGNLNPMNPADIQHLKEVLGEDSVYPLLGEESFSNDPHDYYEPDHFRPVLGARILKHIYGKQAPEQTPHLSPEGSTEPSGEK